MFTLSNVLPAAVMLWALFPAQARSVVTLHNLTEGDLFVTHARGPGLTPLTLSACSQGPGHPCCPRLPEPFGGQVVNSDGLPEPGRPHYEYWLGRGRTATFVWDDPVEDVKADVFLQPGDVMAPLPCHGLLVYRAFAKVWPEPME